VLEGILNVFRALLAPVIAGVVAYIAWQQHKTNRDKLRLDLYDKRLKVFHSLMNLLGFIARDGDCSHSRLGQYCAEIGESRFLFAEDITNYLEEIFTEAGKLHRLEQEIKQISAFSQARKESILNKRAKVFDWLTGQIKESQTRFEKYLNFRCSAGPSERRTMNWKRGFRRIIIVLSLLFFIGCFAVAGYAELGGNVSDKVPDIFLHFDPIYFPRLFGIGAVGSACIWAVYWIVLWIAKGFKDKKPKSKQKQ